MKGRKNRLILEQVSARLKPHAPLAGKNPQPTGWIHSIGTAIGMSLAQLGKRARMTAQGVGGVCERVKIYYLKKNIFPLLEKDSIGVLTRGNHQGPF